MNTAEFEKMDELDRMIEAALHDRANTVQENDLRPASLPDPEPAPHRLGARQWGPLLAAASVAAVAVGVTLIVAGGSTTATPPATHAPSTTAVSHVPVPPPTATTPTAHSTPPATRTSHRAAPHTTSGGATTSGAGTTHVATHTTGKGAGAPPAPDAHTVTFTGVGKLRLGMTRAQVEALGYSSSSGTDGCVHLSAQQQPFVVLDPHSNAVVAIQTFPLTGYHTQAGIGLGSTIAQVRAAYPAGSREEHLAHDFGQGGDGILVRGSGGWLALTVTDGKVSSIAVGTHAHASATETGC